MNVYTLRLSLDDLAPGASRILPAANRVLYVRDGRAVVEAPGRRAVVEAGAAWQGAGPCALVAGGRGAAVLRWELLRRPAAPGPGRLLCEHPVVLDPRLAWLIRCDRVDFAPGSVAHPHRHRGGGIRCLLAGELTVTVGDERPRRIRPGEAWFESGREPVLAVAAKRGPTAFVRVSILPRELRGRTSILYVDPRDAARGRPRRYTVFTDAPIRLA